MVGQKLKSAVVLLWKSWMRYLEPGQTLYLWEH